MITMPLSLPILSVIALFAFGRRVRLVPLGGHHLPEPQDVDAHGLPAAVPDRHVAHPYLVMASLVVAAIPTIIVFLSAQKVLMKGIVVPTEK